ncbi:DNA replication factor C complex subunit Rfc1 [Malassezia cuniculi]|uniref:Replication factor C subunit 1 n=1 Tax=Malassezia cuniculi TaxID=948313 RepID=A0AAF0EWD0_9BASI|nr:DNA replication factor C complex subunit Rfc1 [Malassezia cuniculi]
MAPSGRANDPIPVDDSPQAKRTAPQDRDAKRVKTEGVPAWRAAAARRAAGPVAPGSKEIPQGKPNCLAGLTLVFTGELNSISRDDAVDLAKRYGAKVTTSPSSKTSYVILGENAGAKKLEVIKKNKIKTLDEDGFLALIAQRGAQELDEATSARLKAEEKKIEQAAKDLAPVSGNALLWTDKYAPKQLKELIGNKANVERLQAWLRDWPKSVRANFKKPGPNGMNVFRAVLISGPPGVGKTTAAHLVARIEGYSVLELNASDTRSKKLLESALRDTISNTSLDAWAGGAAHVDGRMVIIMDEVDGMSGGDRGGIGAINALIKKTKVPVICICNDRRNPKMTPLHSTTFNMTFSRPTTQAIRSRMLSIAFREKMQIPAEVMDQLITAAQNDLRLVTNMLSTWRLGQSRMTFDEGKQFGLAHKKPTMQTPFSLYGELTSPQRFGPLNSQSLGDKLDYYFQDHAFVPLMVAENYLKSNPARAAKEPQGAARDREHLRLLAHASASISDGDIIDTMIHGPQQHWSLMPHHGMASSVRPASFIYGGHSGFPSFPAFLGQNSKRMRISRALGELQTRLRLSCTGSKDDVRQSYLGGLLSITVDPVIEQGQAGIRAVIDSMDEYMLVPEDRDTLVELELEGSREAALKKVPAPVKAAFTRAYNAGSHPVAFQRAVAPGKTKEIKVVDVPDNEDVYGADDEVPEEEEEADDDLAGDKLIRAAKPKARRTAK